MRLTVILGFLAGLASPVLCGKATRLLRQQQEDPAALGEEGAMAPGFRPGPGRRARAPGPSSATSAVPSSIATSATNWRPGRSPTGAFPSLAKGRGPFLPRHVELPDEPHQGFSPRKAGRSSPTWSSWMRTGPSWARAGPSSVPGLKAAAANVKAYLVLRGRKEETLGTRGWPCWPPKWAPVPSLAQAEERLRDLGTLRRRRRLCWAGCWPTFRCARSWRKSKGRPGGVEEGLRGLPGDERRREDPDLGGAGSQLLLVLRAGAGAFGEGRRPGRGGPGGPQALAPGIPKLRPLSATPKRGRSEAQGCLEGGNREDVHDPDPGQREVRPNSLLRR